MVDRLLMVVVVSAACFLGNRTQEAQAPDRHVIRSIRVPGKTSFTICPGEPLSIPVAVTCDRIDDAETDAFVSNEWAVGRILSRRLQLDDTVYVNRLSGGLLNEIGRFELAGTSTQEQQAADTFNQSVTYRFVLTLFLNYTNHEFLFGSPGRHTLILGPDGGPHVSVTITVMAPTRDEESVIQFLEGSDGLIFLADLEDCSNCNEEILGELASAHKAAEGTRYDDYLSVVEGVARMCQLQLRRRQELEQTLITNPNAKVSREPYEESIIRLASYFAHLESKAAQSKVDLLGLWNSAAIDLLQAKHAVSEAEYEKYIKRFLELTGRIADSKIAPRSVFLRASPREQLAARAHKEFLSRRGNRTP